MRLNICNNKHENHEKPDVYSYLNENKESYIRYVNFFFLHLKREYILILLYQQCKTNHILYIKRVTCFWQRHKSAHYDKVNFTLCIFFIKKMLEFIKNLSGIYQLMEVTIKEKLCNWLTETEIKICSFFKGYSRDIFFN